MTAHRKMLALATLGGVLLCGTAFGQHAVPTSGAAQQVNPIRVALLFDDGGAKAPEPTAPGPLPVPNTPPKPVAPAPSAPAPKPEPPAPPAKPMPEVKPETPAPAPAKPAVIAPPKPEVPAERPKAELKTGLTPPAAKPVLPADPAYDRPADAPAKPKPFTKPLPPPPSIEPAVPTVKPAPSATPDDSTSSQAVVAPTTPAEPLHTCNDENCRVCHPKAQGWTMGAWLDQGIAILGRPSADGYNGVVTFPDRDREYQMNQLDLFVNRDVKTDGDGVDWGGRFDVLYGTDGRFVQARGLETTWDQTAHYYQLALPQFYFDVGVDDWTIRMGHFYTTLGYETVPAANNFFYTHAYTFQYGEPFTHTGVLLSRKFGESLSVSGGLHRGNDVFSENGKRWSFLGGATWTSSEGRLSLGCNVTSGGQEEGNQTTIYSLVAQWKISERLTYVLQHDNGSSQGGTTPAGVWYGLNQYWLWALNERWGVGSRFEWFRDLDGTRVTGLGVTNAVRGASFAGDFFEFTLGLNWKPNKNVVFRPEVRWDWYDPNTPGLPAPFAAGTRNQQFLTAMDLILSF